jgi:hypothetical protein
MVGMLLQQGNMNLPHNRPLYRRFGYRKKNTRRSGCKGVLLMGVRPDDMASFI